MRLTWAKKMLLGAGWAENTGSGMCPSDRDTYKIRYMDIGQLQKKTDNQKGTIQSTSYTVIDLQREHLYLLSTMCLKLGTYAPASLHDIGTCLFISLLTSIWLNDPIPLIWFFISCSIEHPLILFQSMWKYSIWNQLKPRFVGVMD